VAKSDNPSEPKGVRGFFKRHHAKLWWIHSAYALGLGALVATFAQEGFDNARWLVLTVVATWILAMLVFRFFGTGRQRKLDTAGSKIRFYAMTYFLKNLYQGMLFFLLPFYWKSATWGEPNGYFLVVLGTCAFLSTMDVIFDNFLMKWRGASSIYYGFTLFACLNLAIPALLPDTGVLTSMLSAAGVTVVAFWGFHFSLRLLSQPLYAGLLLVLVTSGVSAAYLARMTIPPVPLYIKSGAVGPSVFQDKRLSMQLVSIHATKFKGLHATTDVVIPGGAGDEFQHVWRFDGKDVYAHDGGIIRIMEGEGVVRVHTELPVDAIPENPVGTWSVDVLTGDGMLIGRVKFEVTG
jgi:hypothetical protein